MAAFCHFHCSSTCPCIIGENAVVIEVSEGGGMAAVRETCAKIRNAEYGQTIILRGSHLALALYKLLRLEKVCVMDEVPFCSLCLSGSDESASLCQGGDDLARDMMPEEIPQ